MNHIVVTTAPELLQALEQQASEIRINGTIAGVPSITLPPGTALSGGRLEFKAKGVRLSRNNTLSDIEITTTEHEVAVYNDTTIPDAGTLRLQGVTTVGQVLIVAQEDLQRIRVEIDGLQVLAADLRGRVEQPHGYGVDVLQGGLTLWNRQADPASVFTATLTGVSVGTEETPVRGSGVFLAGHADREGHTTGGILHADLLETLEIVTDGGITPGTPDKISGGVFVVSGAVVDRVEINGPVTTHGANDMVLDLWGETPSWVVNAPVLSTGPSGIGFVNFGVMGDLEVNAPITTTGVGARGFNLYDGSIASARFESITTTGDGAIGIQISKPMGPITVRGDVRTSGGTGMSLVKGVQTRLQATAVSIKPGGDVQAIHIGGRVETSGKDLVAVEVHEGARVREFRVDGGIHALGEGSRAVAIDGVAPGLDVAE